MEFLSYVSGPVVGAVIGYITNYIAIKMLFRPARAYYVFGRRVPFTPGIVPRRKDELAKILGDAIVAKFFNADDLEIVFTSDYFSSAVADRVTRLLRSESTLGAMREELSDEALNKLEDELCVRIQAAVCTSDLPAVFAREGGRMAASLMGRSVAGKAVSAGVADAISEPLSREIEEFIIHDGRKLILPLVKKEVERLSREPVGNLTALLSGGDDALIHAAVKKLYMRFMLRNVRPIVESIDVGGMITDKIVLMSATEVEDLVLTVVNRELKLVVLFGALVGGLIGVVNIFI